jgi:hypothetical protein
MFPVVVPTLLLLLLLLLLCAVSTPLQRAVAAADRAAAE